MAEKHAESQSKSAGGKPVSEARESSLVVAYAFDMAAKLEIDHILVRADLLQDRRLVERHGGKEKLIWLVQDDEFANKAEGSPKDI